MNKVKSNKNLKEPNQALKAVKSGEPGLNQALESLKQVLKLKYWKSIIQALK